MLTVPEAADRAGRDPETVRRWIRAGKLRARKVGTQHVIEERDLDDLIGETSTEGWPKVWDGTWTGEPPPDWVKIVRRSRRGH
jgi:excisionase family DNA binding protein